MRETARTKGHTEQYSATFYSQWRLLHWGLELLVLALGCWAYWPTLTGLFSAWNSNPDYSHGFLVPLIALGFLWARRDLRPSSSGTMAFGGILLLVGAGALRFLAGRFYLPELDSWSLPIWLGGVVWLFHGSASFRWVLPSLGFLWFATPLPATLETMLSTPLQHLAAQWGSWTLRLANYQAISEGTTILLQEQVLDIERACSGLRMFYGIFALAVASVIFARLRGWRAAATLLAAVPIALVANVARIVITGVLLESVSGEAARKFSHDFAGLMMLPLAVVLFSLLVLWLAAAASHFSASQANGMNWLLKWGCLAVACTAAVFWWGQYQHRHVLRAMLDTVSQCEQADDWQGAVGMLHRYLQLNPQDNEEFVHLAELYSKTAVTRSDQEKAIALAQRAWKMNPRRTDLAWNAARTAFDIGDFPISLQLCNELLNGAEIKGLQDCDIKALRADALLAYRNDERFSVEYTWENLANILQATRDCANQPMRFEVELARLWQSKLIEPDQKTRRRLGEKIMNKVVEDHSEDASAWLARHQFAIDFGLSQLFDRDQREQDLKQALAKIEKAKPPARAKIYFAAASYAQRESELNEAERYLRLAIEATPENPRYYAMLAELIRTSDAAGALISASEILRVGLQATREDNIALLLPLASIQTELEAWSVAEEILARVEANSNPPTGRHETQQSLGVALVRTQILWHQEGTYAAIRQLESVVNSEGVQLYRQFMPELTSQAFVLLGRMYSSVSIFDRASEQFRFALQLEPHSRQTRTEAISAAISAGDVESAELHCRVLLGDEPRDQNALLSMVRIQVLREQRKRSSARDWSRSERALEVARKQEVDSAGLLLAEVELLAARGDFPEAEKLLLQAVEQFPEEPLFWRELAVLLDSQEQEERALHFANRYLQLAPQEIQARVLKATLLIKLNRIQEAQDELNEFLAKCQGSQRIVAAREVAKLHLLLGNVEAAKSLLLQLHRDAPDDLAVLSSLASLAWASGDWQVLKKYESALRGVEGESGTVWRFHRAERLLEEVTSRSDPTFEEVRLLAQSLQELRPRWAKTSLLLGDIALRTGKTESAIASYERAWALGERSAMLADHLLELLSQAGRIDEAQSYVSQLRGAFALSSRLFDRALPFLLQENRHHEALRLAEAWVDRKPKDAGAHLRLGRVLRAMGSRNQPQAARHSSRAEQEFRRALQLDPENVNTWIANAEVMSQSNFAEGSVDTVLSALSQLVDLDEGSRALVMAQVFEAADLPLQAQSEYQRAVQQAQLDQASSKQAEALTLTARFYLASLPSLATVHARAALSLDPNSSAAQKTLLEALAAVGTSAATQEALTLLSTKAMPREGDDFEFVRRLEARFLAQLGNPKQVARAIELLENLLAKTPDDKRLLAALYEQTGRLGPALELFGSLVESPAVGTKDQAAFLQFWQRQFLQKTSADQRPKFYALSAKVYDELLQQPSRQDEWLRWKMRELSHTQAAAPITWAEVSPLIRLLFETNEGLGSWSHQAKLVWARGLFRVLLKEDGLSSAAGLVRQVPATFSPVDAAVALCHAIILNSSSTLPFQSINDFLHDIQQSHPDRADLFRSVGDYQFMTGQYELAVEAYREALRLEPTHMLSKNNLALSLAEQPGQLAEAKAILHAAVDEHGEDPVLLDTRAVIEILDQRPEAALASLEQVMNRSPRNAMARIHQAMAFQLLGQEDRARESVLDALVLDENRMLLSPRDRAFIAEATREVVAAERENVASRVIDLPATYVRSDEQAMVLSE